MKRFSERNPIILGLIGTVVLVGALVLSLTSTSIPFLFGGGRSYHAEFSESGGLGSGDEVELAGLSIGKVTGVSLDHGTVRVTFQVSNGGAHLGSTTSAAIVTETVLGKRGLRLDTSGSGTLATGATIPLSRTTPPYDLTDALSGLTKTTGAIDTASFADALQTLTATFKDTPSSVRASISGLSRLSTTFASRDAEISNLLGAADNVSTILAQRSGQVTKLLDDGTTLLLAINARRQTITSLITQVTALAKQLRGLVADNRKTLAPALTKLTTVTTILNKNKKNLDEILDRAGPFAGSLGESVSSGPFFQAYVQNLTKPVDLEGLDTSPLCPLLGCDK